MEGARAAHDPDWTSGPLAYLAMIEVVGGPLDGLVKQLRDPPVFMWLNVDFPHEAYRKPGPGRLPHKATNRLQPRADKLAVRVYIFIGHTHTTCWKCKGLRRRAGRCIQCGVAPEPQRA